MKTQLLNIAVLIFCLDLRLQGQTINLVDTACKKQGLWVVLGKDKPGTCYKPFQKVEEGEYLNNRKTGVWKEYYCNGNIKNIITFSDGRPEGPMKMYYQNGQLDEVGLWSQNRWVDYKKYSTDGKLYQAFKFDENGKRKDSINPEFNNLYDYPDGKRPIFIPHK